MQYRPLGSSGLKVSAIGLGSWLTIGNAIDDASSVDLVAHAFERGVNLFDTADVYNQGEGERALGKSIRDLPRHRLVVATKCYFAMSEDVNDRGLSRKHIHESLKKSLQRLGTDYVDLYQCHRFDPETPVRETALAMHDLIQQGHTLYWGTSMWPAERIAEVVALCRREGWHVPISNQPLFNLYRRDIEAAVVPTSQREGLGQLVAIAEQHGLDATRVALAFCLRTAGISSVLVGARSKQQLEHNLSALDVELSAECLAQVEEVFPA